MLGSEPCTNATLLILPLILSVGNTPDGSQEAMVVEPPAPAEGRKLYIWMTGGFGQAGSPPSVVVREVQNHRQRGVEVLELL